MAKPIPLA